MSRMR